MFFENNDHLQQGLFDSMSFMHPRIKTNLEKSWAGVFYREVFCKIDESAFKVLYCEDNGRPNTPVNILFSLELIKHLFNYVDEVLVEQYHFNIQVRYALGLRDFAEHPITLRTLYAFRKRICSYTKANPDDDLIFDQFRNLTEHFLAVANIKTTKQRVDSTQVMPNIKRAGRLSVAFDVLEQAVKNCPQDLLPESLKQLLDPNFEKELLYRSKASEAKSKLQTLLDLCSELVELAQKHQPIAELESVQLVKRFLEEQASFDDEKGNWIAKPGKELNSDCLQSAYDPDATFRKKGDKEHIGYVVNISETCNEENPVQLITDFAVEKNNVHDTTLLEERLDTIKETGATELYVDGGYYSEDVINDAQKANIDLRFTNMTGTTPNTDKLSITDFDIEGNEIKACPAGEPSRPCYFNKKSRTLTAHFDIKKCRNCQYYDICPTKKGKKSAIINITTKSLLAAQTRQRLKEERKENTSKRAAIEGTNSAFKRCGADELRVRTLVKCRIVLGLKIIGRNIRQIWRYFTNDIRKSIKERDRSVPNGALIPA